MANKYYGNVGFAVMREIRPSVNVEEMVVHPYYGEINKNARRLESNGQVNPDIVVTNTISIVSDPYALNNFHAIRYVEWMGAKWTVTHVDVAYPRLNLTLGGVYNGSTGPST